MSEQTFQEHDVGGIVFKASDTWRVQSEEEIPKNYFIAYNQDQLRTQSLCGAFIGFATKAYKRWASTYPLHVPCSLQHFTDYIFVTTLQHAQKSKIDAVHGTKRHEEPTCMLTLLLLDVTKGFPRNDTDPGLHTYTRHSSKRITREVPTTRSHRSTSHLLVLRSTPHRPLAPSDCPPTLRSPRLVRRHCFQEQRSGE